ncbi:MAG: diguanylate cyclase [Actinobacteria bacterium]|nr:diguanylate cyclase [Actinomycetota bacterium]MBV8562294.1 diguanylate cyclase [Actinomycetota bacterium]
MTPVILAGVTAIGAAVYSYSTSHHTMGAVAALASFLVVMILAEHFPVPVEGMESDGVTLGFVFAVATIILLGWQAGVLIAAGGVAFSKLGRRPPIRIAYNSSMFALSALAGGLAAAQIHGNSTGALIAKVALAAFLYNWVVNLALISAVLAASSDRSFFEIAWENVRQTTAPFALMASASLMLVVLWQRSPALSVALVGPLLAIALYQRSTFKALRAMRLALTDPLTGLGNHRSFHERLQRELTTAEHSGGALSLCLVDIDDFKLINDRFGHPVGDEVLGLVASRLRQGGESFRLGGDEFAVLLPDHDERQAVAVANSIVERVGMVEIQGVGAITASAGVATYSQQGVGRDELIRLADSALYWAKEDGKNTVRTYEPQPLELTELTELAEGPDRAARYRAAASLAKAVDARDAYTGSHSERVSELATRIARRLGVDETEVELTRLAASLHDLGKLAIPEEILRKPAALTDTERLVLERHPQIGFHMLESLGVEPVAEYVLHHHERWDGSGYPNGLRGDEIPLGARIIFVADAFDAMTSDRVYRRSRSEREALAELSRCAGSQFDPAIVDAFAEEIEGSRSMRPVAGVSGSS